MRFLRFWQFKQLGVLHAVYAVALASGLGCGGPSKYPARPSDCEVAVYQEPPSAAIDNIGVVYADCDESIGRKECVKQLKEETCKLGGDVVWDIPEEPRALSGKLRLSGRAAHTRGAGEPEVEKKRRKR